MNCRIDYILPERLEKSLFQSNKSLNNLTILRQPIGTNFKMTKNEVQGIDKNLNFLGGRFGPTC